MSRIYTAYTLWMKWRNVGWRPEFTVISEHSNARSPIEVIEKWMDCYHRGGYFQRGKTWIIKPKGQKPAELNRQEEG